MMVAWSGMCFVIGGLGLVALAVLLIVGLYNKLVSLREQVRAAGADRRDAQASVRPDSQSRGNREGLR